MKTKLLNTLVAAGVMAGSMATAFAAQPPKMKMTTDTLKFIITLIVTAVLSTHMAIVMSAPEIDTPNPTTSDFWDRGDLGYKNILPSLGGNSLQLAQENTGDKAKSASGNPPKKGKYTQAQLNEMINNPLGELWLLFIQNDTTWYDGDALDFLGEGKKVFNTTTIQPVLSMQFTENVKYIFRPVIPVHHWDAPSVSEGNAQYPGGDLPFSVDFGQETELGDIVLWNAFATNEMVKPPNIYGAGVTFMLDTATEDVFGTGKNSAGPMALAFHIGDPGEWILGTVVQHWWDFSGDDDRQDVNTTNIQYVAFYRYSAETNIGFGSPNITINHEADSGQKVTLPVGLGWNTTTKIGPLPVKIGAEVYKYIESPDNFGADYGLRLIFSPVVPSPSFAKRPIF